MTIEQLKSKIESETGLKISVKVNPISSSLRGYVRFTPKKTGEVFPEWGCDYGRKLAVELKKEEPYPTFVNSYNLEFYLGNTVYNK